MFGGRTNEPCVGISTCCESNTFVLRREQPSAASIQRSGGEELDRLPPVEMEGIKGKVHTILGIYREYNVSPFAMVGGRRRHKKKESGATQKRFKNTCGDSLTVGGVSRFVNGTRARSPWLRSKSDTFCFRPQLPSQSAYCYMQCTHTTSS